MKRFKKMMALVIAMVMVLGVTTMALAADGDPTGSITIKPNTGVTLESRTLKAYKILDATYSGDAVAYTVPANMKSFYDGYFGQKADNTVDPPVEAKTASQLAAALGQTLDYYVTQQMKDWGDDSALIKDFATAALAYAKDNSIPAITGEYNNPNVEFLGLAAGYYVIEDTGSDKPVSAIMLDTVTNANVDIQIKVTDESEKEIMTAGDLANNKANELGVGRTVNYKYTQKVPDTTGYDYYYYMINDTLSNGLTFDPDSVVVKVGNTTLVKNTHYYLYADKTADADVLGSKTFIVAFKDMVADIAAKTYKAGDTITVTYNATVNSNAIVGVDPNNNKANITYSNNPNKDGRGDFDEDHPGIPANDGNHPTGEGPDKWTDTYTEKITILKVDGTNSDAPLPGVEFTLTGTSKDAVFNQEEVFEINPAGEYWLLKNGTYTKTTPQTVATLTETTGASGWVEIVSGDNYAGADIRVVGGKNYRPYVEATDSAKTRYIIVEANDADYASVTTKYSKVTKTADAAEEYSVSRTGTTGADGTLNFSQLGAGTYKLSETGVLAGYNGLPDITFTLTCTPPQATAVIAGNEKATWTISNVTPSNVEFIQQTDGTFKITLQNNKGAELPSTGGIGTTIFYVLGAILVLGAGILLVTRRRMSAN